MFINRRPLFPLCSSRGLIRVCCGEFNWLIQCSDLLWQTMSIYCRDVNWFEGFIWVACNGGLESVRGELKLVANLMEICFAFEIQVEFERFWRLKMIWSFLGLVSAWSWRVKKSWNALLWFLSCFERILGRFSQFHSFWLIRNLRGHFCLHFKHLKCSR